MRWPLEPGEAECRDEQPAALITEGLELCPADRAAASQVTEVGPAWPSGGSSRGAV